MSARCRSRRRLHRAGSVAGHIDRTKRTALVVCPVMRLSRQTSSAVGDQRHPSPPPGPFSQAVADARVMAFATNSSRVPWPPIEQKCSLGTNDHFYTRCSGRYPCLLYTSDAADDLLCVDLGGRRI